MLRFLVCKSGDYFNSVSLVDRAIQAVKICGHNTRIPFYRILKGKILLQLGFIEQSQDEFYSAKHDFLVYSGRNPGFSDLYLCESFINQYALDSALSRIEVAVEAFSSSDNQEYYGLALSTAGLVNLMSGELSESARLFDRAAFVIDKYGNSSDKALNLIRMSALRLELKDYQEAIDGFHETLATDSSFQFRLFSQYGIALASYRMGEKNTAIQLLEQCNC